MSSQLLALLLLLSTVAVHHLPVATCNSWCVALPAATHEQLQFNIKFACSYVDCSAIQPGGSCYYPNTLLDHASFVMNIYYNSQGRSFQACSFGNTGYIIDSDPSAESCIY
ncbi:Glucan endo-1,3-beta-glucosidase [Cardamine amara subsp. amara]|uniref:Glucan endo-1,3-beta-glucosidase n=1 Tax=Cardamine amara subsp. amara TaxID=228776 RepID=A0ABD1B3W5_CARAN